MDTEPEKISYVYGDVCVRTKRRKRQKLIVIELIFDYFQNSTLHGLRYIAERGLSIIERLFWFLTVVASVIMCALLIYSAYVKWKTSPVIVTVNGRLASVGTVPFPAVTICPAIKVKQTVFNYTEQSKKVDDMVLTFDLNSTTSALFDEITHKLENINTVCDYPRLYFAELGNLSKNLIEYITEVALTPEDIFFECKWHNKDADCTQLFHRVYTGEGVCYTSNNLAATELFTDNIQKDYSYLESQNTTVGWSAETGEYNFSMQSHYPRRGRVYGLDPDMVISLTIDPDQQDIACNTLYSGYKTSSVAVSFHQLNTDVNMLTSKTFKYPAKIRQCYFQSERPLRYFKLYTASNCRAECLSNYTYNRCKCVDYYMPHHNSSEICSKMMKKCMEDARDDMTMKERSAELDLEENAGTCLCRPSCDNIEYDAEILKTDYHLAQSFKVNYGMEEILKDVRFARVELFFKKPQFVTMQRRELFGITDFLADIGGLLGLFLGFSFISLVEIFYFITLRLGIKLKRDLTEEKLQKMRDRTGKYKV